jgi:hypothetical protein
MSNKYGIEPAGPVLERCKKEDAMYETAKQLVDTAVNRHMQMFGIDRETARYWLQSAAEASD